MKYSTRPKNARDRWGGDSFFNQIKKCWLHAGKISVAWYVNSDYFIQECSVVTSLLSAVSRAGPMDSVASVSFWVVGGDGDAGRAGAGFCCLLCVEITTYKNKFNSIKTKGPSSDLSVALDVYLNGISQGRGGGYIV